MGGQIFQDAPVIVHYKNKITMYMICIYVTLRTYHLLVKVIDSSWYDAVNLNFEARFPTRCSRFQTLMLETQPVLQMTSNNRLP